MAGDPKYTSDPLARTVSQRSASWHNGFHAGYAQGVMRSPSSADPSEWTSGYLVGRRKREDDDLMQHVEEATGDVE